MKYYGDIVDALWYDGAMSELLKFGSLHVDAPVERIMRRLGFREGTTELAGKKAADIKIAILEASDLLDLTGAARVLPILENADGRVRIGFGPEEQQELVTFESAKLAGFLAGQKEAVFAGATAGMRVMDRIRQLTAENRLSAASVIDVTASEMVDDALERVIDAVRHSLSPRGMEVSRRRYSAGYGDFELSAQAVFHRVLDMESMGVTLTPQYLLVPEKSVTAIAGIWDL
jgi:hypothetical protein